MLVSSEKLAEEIGVSHSIMLKMIRESKVKKKRQGRKPNMFYILDDVDFDASYNSLLKTKKSISKEQLAKMKKGRKKEKATT